MVINDDDDDWVVKFNFSKLTELLIIWAKASILLTAGAKQPLKFREKINGMETKVELQFELRLIRELWLRTPWPSL